MVACLNRCNILIDCFLITKWIFLSTLENFRNNPINYVYMFGLQMLFLLNYLSCLTYLILVYFPPYTFISYIQFLLFFTRNYAFLLLILICTSVASMKNYGMFIQSDNVLFYICLLEFKFWLVCALVSTHFTDDLLLNVMYGQILCFRLFPQWTLLRFYIMVIILDVILCIQLKITPPPHRK